MRILVTRPQPDADRQADTLRARGYEVTVEPLLDVEFLDAGVLTLEGVQALIATSRNGLRALARNQALEKARRLPLFAVGTGTGALARTLGFSKVSEGHGTGETLARVVAERCDPRRGALLHLAGENLAFDLKGVLEARGFEVRQPVLYRAVPSAGLSAPVREAVAGGGIDAVLLMSPATARAWACLAGEAGLAGAAREMCHFCLSRKVAGELAALGVAKGRVFVPEVPREDGLLALIAREAAH